MVISPYESVKLILSVITLITFDTVVVKVWWQFSFCNSLRHSRWTLAPGQGPTGTRYPTRTRSFFPYPIRTRFIFKVIGYVGYRVFQKTMFLTRKTASRSYKISNNIIFCHIHLTNMDWSLLIVLWDNFNGTLHNYVTLVFLWVLHMLLHQIEARLSTMEE